MAELVNDVNVPKIKELDATVRATPDLGKLTLKATSTWERGTKCLVTVGPAQALGQVCFRRRAGGSSWSTTPTSWAASTPPRIPSRR
jgi:hypothetical protein